MSSRQYQQNNWSGTELYAQGQLAHSHMPFVTESYLHQQRVQSKFRKHAYRLQYVMYGLILTAVVFGLVQTTRTLVSGIYKLSILSGQQTAVEGYHQKSIQENQALSERIRTYSAPAGIEELARNNLEMVGKGEVLVRIH